MQRQAHVTCRLLLSDRRRLCGSTSHCGCLHRRLAGVRVDSDVHFLCWVSCVSLYVGRTSHHPCHICREVSTPTQPHSEHRPACACSAGRTFSPLAVSCSLWRPSIVITQWSPRNGKRGNDLASRGSASSGAPPLASLAEHVILYAEGIARPAYFIVTPCCMPAGWTPPTWDGELLGISRKDSAACASRVCSASVHGLPCEMANQVPCLSAGGVASHVSGAFALKSITLLWNRSVSHE